MPIGLSWTSYDLLGIRSIFSGIQSLFPGIRGLFLIQHNFGVAVLEGSVAKPVSAVHYVFSRNGVLARTFLIHLKNGVTLQAASLAAMI